MMLADGYPVYPLDERERDDYRSNHRPAARVSKEEYGRGDRDGIGRRNVDVSVPQVRRDGIGVGVDELLRLREVDNGGDFLRPVGTSRRMDKDDSYSVRGGG